MRLNKFLARAGVASRRNCDEFIKSGKVVVNGSIERNFSYQVTIEDTVVCGGTLLDSLPKRKVYLVNKLKGYISTSSDPHGRKRVIDLVKSNDRLFTVGRLDRDTTGAILVTNDGELSNQLMHPRYKIERVYIAATKIEISREKWEKLLNGVKLDTGAMAKGKMKKLQRKGGLIYWELTLKEGKNREVKRIFKALGSEVIHLHRHSFAGLDVEYLKPGKSRLLKENEINPVLDVGKR